MNPVISLLIVWACMAVTMLVLYLIQQRTRNATVVDVDVATGCAAGANRRRAVEVPDARLEAEILIGQRPYRTDVGNVARIMVVELDAGEDVDARVVAALEDAELSGAGDRYAEQGLDQII